MHAGKLSTVSWGYVLRWFDQLELELHFPEEPEETASMVTSSERRRGFVLGRREKMGRTTMRPVSHRSRCKWGQILGFWTRPCRDSVKNLGFVVGLVIVTKDRSSSKVVGRT